MQTIVIGHKNPDMDSICSAIGYARLKQLLGVPDIIAARAGNTNARIDYVLKRFHVAAPVFLSDVSPRVSDVMRRDSFFVQSDVAIYDAIQMMAEKELRGLPVVDKNNRCLGMLSSFKLSHYLFPPREEASSARIVEASLAGIVKTFAGTVISGEISNEAVETLLMVGAMDLNTFTQRMERQRDKKIVLFVGDREHIQMAAIECKARAIVVTGGLPILDRVREAAQEKKVTLVSSPYDTATTVLLARGALRAERLLEHFISFNPDTPLEAARERAATSTSSVFPVVGEGNVLLGIITKSDFLKPVPRRLILVDHNELSQAVQGADKIPIVEILDHHRIGFTSNLPIHFWNNPVGSTSTIVTLCYQQMGVPIPSDIAGLLMAGLISDTLNLTSPTATPVDSRVLDHLAKIASTDPAELAEQIFSVGSPLLTMTPAQVITADCKEYEDSGRRFTVSQIEELNFARFTDKQSELFAALESHCWGRGLFFAALMVTDINTQNSLLLVAGAPTFLERITFPAHGPHIWELDGIVSRKKQLLPYLLQCLTGAGAG
ncbi:MAG: Cobalt-dependent inorganic pyrophosphatase [Pedosphaera sp.]|nr:Cobalt-dependent inorganic pyrophosphatase [Pedosphaera sp.]